MYLRNGNSFPNENKTFLNTPPLTIRDITKPIKLNGAVISQSNTTINCEGNNIIKIFMGHGAGDKKYGGTPTPLETYDYHFISGNKHLQKLKDLNVKIARKKQIKIGYPKFDSYVNNQINKKEYLNHLGIIDKNRKKYSLCTNMEMGQWHAPKIFL